MLDRRSTGPTGLYIRPRNPENKERAWHASIGRTRFRIRAAARSGPLLRD
jgi:hypothetical protein